MIYFQCSLAQGELREMAWIEDRGAHKGCQVELKGEDGLWEVIEVYYPGQSKEWLQENNSKSRRTFHSGDIVRGNK